MRLGHAVPQTSPKSSRSPRLPFYKNRPLPTRSESTLLQLLIPLHFNSCRYNVYKKPGEGRLVPAAKFCNSSLRTCQQTRRARVDATPSFSSDYAHFPSHIGCTPSTSNRPTQALPCFSTPSKHAHTGKPATPFLSCVYFTVPCIPGVRYPELSRLFLCPLLRFRYNLLLVRLKENA